MRSTKVALYVTVESRHLKHRAVNLVKLAVFSQYYYNLKPQPGEFFGFTIVETALIIILIYSAEVS